MSKPKTLTREEYEQKVKGHVDAIRRLAKRFNPEICHINMAIVGSYEWSIAYLPDAEDGSTRKASDWLCLYEEHEGMKPYFVSWEIEDEQ